ncbi:MAG: class I SAM-dependent methyltransferase [Candidatus Hydrothermarchaeota archaeon]
MRKKELRGRYNQTAWLYDKRYEEIQNKKYSEILEKVKVDQSDVILDLGCGTGLFLEKIKSNRVFGLDFSEKMIEIARGKLDHEVHLVLADCDFLPFKHNIFTKLFSFTLLQNSENPLDTLREMVRVCRDGALLIVTILEKNISEDDFKKILEKAGLKSIQVWKMEVEDIAGIGVVKKTNKWR